MRVKVLGGGGGGGGGADVTARDSGYNCVVQRQTVSPSTRVSTRSTRPLIHVLAI